MSDAEMPDQRKWLKTFLSYDSWRLNGSFLRGGITGATAMLAVSVFAMGSNPVNTPKAGDIFSRLEGSLDDREAGVRKAVNLFSDAFILAEKQHVKEVLEPGNVESMINGALRALDPYSGFLEAGLADGLLDTNLEPRYQIGVLMRSHDGLFLIESVVPDSPSERAGVKAGDKILQVGDRFVANENPEVVSKVIQEAVQSASQDGVSLLLQRADQEVSVVINPDLEDKVSAYGLGVSEGVLHVFVQRFFPGTSEDVSKIIDKALAEHDLTGVIIDLRGNGGGLTTEALALSELFLPEDKLLYEMTGRSVGTQLIKTSEPQKYADLNIAVITNGRTGSASEIFASAIQAHDRGSIVGWKSLGKGTVQRIYPVEGGAVKVTVATYKDALGRTIEGVGVNQDIEIRMPDPILRPSRYDRDAALKAAQNFIGGAGE